MANTSSVNVKCHCGQEVDIPEIQGYAYCPNCNCMYTIDQMRSQIGKLESCAVPRENDKNDIWDSFYNELLTQGCVHKIQGELAQRKEDNTKAMAEYSEAVAFFKRAGELKPTEAAHKNLITEVSSKMDHVKNKGTKSGGCFIATAAFGTALAPEVLYLQQYRNSVLSTSKLGRTFINAYYTISPPVARTISKSIVLRALTRFFFLKPLINILRYLYPAQSNK